MGTKLIVAPTLEPLSLADARMQCNITAGDTTFDSELTAYIAAARAKAENYMGAVLMQRTVDQTLDRFPFANEADITIEQPPAWNSQCVSPLPLSITSISYVDEDGATQTLSGVTYALDDSNWPFWILPAVDTDWPSTQDQANAVTIRMVKGYDAQSKIPGDVRGWILLTVGYLFAQREAFDATGKVSDIPNRFVDSLLDPYRVFTV
jgi:uncharacterized phiE125 gp8 family phage protein